MTRRKSFLIASSIVGVLVGAADAQPTHRSVFLSGQPMPGLGEGVQGRVTSLPGYQLGPAQINNAGELMFMALLSGPGITQNNDLSLLRAGPDGLHLAVRESDPAPGMPAGVSYDRFLAFRNAAPGQITYHASVRGRVNNGADGIWSGPIEAPSLVVQRGDRVLDTSHDPHSLWTVHLNRPSPIPLRFTPAGDVTICDQYALYGHSDESPGVRMIVALGTPAPAIAPDAYLGGPQCHLPIPINSAGQIAFQLLINNENVYSSSIWTATGSDRRLVARAHTPAPGTSSTFGNVGYVSLNSKGDVAFLGWLSGADPSNSQGIWLSSGGENSLVVRTGDPAPSTSAVFAGVRASLFDNGVMIHGRLMGPGVEEDDDFGYWTGTAGNLKLFLREGDVAPGIGGDAVIDVLDDSSLRALNRHGQALIRAELRGTGVGDANDEAVWLSDADGQLHLIAREGDCMAVGPGDLRRIRGSTVPREGEINYGDDGNPMILNEHGELALTLRFDDSHGIFVFSVPEPATIGALFVCALLLRRRPKSC